MKWGRKEGIWMKERVRREGRSEGGGGKEEEDISGGEGVVRR
jgi:hypothetical protein